MRKLLRNKLFLVGLVCIAPVALGSLAYLWRWDTGAAGNYGELIEPRPLAGPALDALKGKWVLVTFDPPACGAACEKKLYIVRQIRRAQGQDMERIERLWMLTSAGSPLPALAAAVEGERIVPFDPDFSGRFPATRADDIYLVDPLGNLMLRYPKDPEPEKMIKDLQRLLRYSHIG
jgi:hypothetical protein